MSNKTIYIFILIWIIPIMASAQNDSIAKRFKKEFNSFNQSIQQKHQGFREKNDSVFSRFLKDSWASFDVLYKGKPAESKPIVQPKIVKPAKELVLPSEEISTDSSKTNSIPEQIKNEIQIEKNEPHAPIESGGSATLNIDFYGNESKLSYPSEIPQIEQISAESISDYFIQTSNSPSILRLVAELQSLKKKLQLNDWGFYQLVESCAAKLESDSSSKTLLVWVILIKNGYNAKTGFSGNRIFLLLPFQEELFNNYFININGQEYYIPADKVKEDEIKQLTIHKADYPGNSIFSLIMVQLPDLGDQTIHRDLVFSGTTISVNENERLINFEKDYPMCEMKVYFSSPLSEIVLNSLENYFKPLLTGLTDKEKVVIILEFIQKAFPYQSDKE